MKLKPMSVWLLAVCGMVCLFADVGRAQGPQAWTRASTEVLREGIAQHRLSVDITWVEDFFTFDTVYSTTDSLHSILGESYGLRPKVWTVDTTHGVPIADPDSSNYFLIDSLGVWLELTARRAANSGVDMQLTQAPFRLARGHELYVETKFKLGNLNHTRFFVGLCSTAVAPADSMQTGIGIGMRADDSTLVAWTSNVYATGTNSTYRDSTKLLKVFDDTTNIVYAFSYDGDTTITHWIAQGDTTDLKMVYSQDSTKFQPAQTVCLRPTIALRSRALIDEGDAPKLWVDYIYVRQQRR